SAPRKIAPSLMRIVIVARCMIHPNAPRGSATAPAVWFWRGGKPMSTARPSVEFTHLAGAARYDALRIALQIGDGLFDAVDGAPRVAHERVDLAQALP